MPEYKRLDTTSFDALIKNKDKFLLEYSAIQKEYLDAVDDLIGVWEGKGAKTFYEDAMVIKTNIVGIGDILQTMCDMLIDCKNVFAECDVSIGNVNKDAL